METNEPNQVQKLFEYLMTGARIACKDSYQRLQIADLRSRISNVEDRYNIEVKRERVKGKRYNEYYLELPNL